MGRYFDIEVVHYADDGVWVAVSDDIKGLTVECDSLETFLDTLVEISTELLAHNHGLSDAEIEDATIRVKNLRHVRQNEIAPARQRRQGSQPKLMFNHSEFAADTVAAA